MRSPSSGAGRRSSPCCSRAREAFRNPVAAAVAERLHAQADADTAALVTDVAIAAARSGMLIWLVVARRELGLAGVPVGRTLAPTRT